MLLCAFVSLCVPLCAFGQEPYVPYTPGSTAPQPQPYYQPQPQPERQMVPVPVPQPSMVIQSANDSAMLEAVRQGKGFNLRVDLIDQTERQWRQYQYQQPCQTVQPYQCPRQYYDCYGRPIYWDGYQWRYYQQQHCFGLSW